MSISQTGATRKPASKAKKKAPVVTGPQPRADINGWVLCPGDSVLIVDPPQGEHHGLFAKVDAFPTTLELSSYVQIDGRPSQSGRVLMPCAMLRWVGPDETLIDQHYRPTRPGQRVRVVLDNTALASEEMKRLEGKLGTTTEFSPFGNGYSTVTVKLDDPDELPAAINSFDLLVVPIPVVQYVPEPEEATGAILRDADGRALQVGDEVRVEQQWSVFDKREGHILEIHPRLNGPVATVGLTYADGTPGTTPFSGKALVFLRSPATTPASTPEAALPQTALRLSTKAWDALETIALVGGECWPKDFTTDQGKEAVAELVAAGLLAGADGYYLLTGAGRAALPDADAEPAPVATEPAAEPERLSVVAMVQEIPLSDIDISRNYRQVFDEADLAELATSIEAHGVMQPVLVRPTPAGHASQPYQLVYGGRRYKGAALAGLTTIPATVRELSDLAFAEMQLVENVQRKDVRPSDEARAFHDLLTKHGKSPEELSHQVGRPVKFVLQRAKLVTLAPFWMQALEQERLPLVAAHELARLPEAGQSLLEDAALRSYDLKRADAVFTVQWVRSGISQWVLADLNAAFFRKDDATLFPKAGACIACPKRSGACQGLFDEVELKHDYCLDKPCFEQKKVNLVERHKEELRKQTGKKAVLISSNYYQVPAGVFDCYRYKEAKQQDADAVQAVMIDGAEMGRIKWVVLKAQASTGSSKDKEADAIRLRKERLTKTHRTLIAEKLTADLPAAVATQGPVYESILTWLLLEECGTSKNTLAYLADSWGWEPSEADIRNDYNDKDAQGFRPWHRFVLRMIGPMSLKQRMEMYLALKVRHRMDYDYEDRQFTIAKLVNGLGYPELEAEAEQAIVARYYTKKTKGAKV